MNKESEKLETKEGLVGKRVKIVMDTRAIPNSMSAEMFVKLAEQGFVFWDSELGVKPRLFLTNDKNEEEEIVLNLVDTKGKEVDVDAFNAQYQENEYWRKEMYKCKQSPLYYFENYYCLDAEITQAQIDEFFHSIGLREQTAAESSDSEKAMQLYDAQKEAREAFAKTVDLEFLKERKPQKDLARAKFEEYCKDLTKKAKKIVGVNSKNDTAFHDKAVNFICRQDVKGKYTDEAKNCIIKGKWDRKVVRLCETYILSRIIVDNF